MASKILLADDSITIQKVVNLTFADEGIEVIAVSNGDHAERRLAEIAPDLVLADIFMPGKNGYELCEFIKQSPHFHNVPVVLLVGAFEPFDQLEARRVRADAHLTKPFESRTLVETVRKLINTSRRPPAAVPSQAIEPGYKRTTDQLGSNPLPAPPVNIDLSAMSDSAPSPVITETGQLDATAIDMAALNQTTPHGLASHSEEQASYQSTVEFSPDLGRQSQEAQPQQVNFHYATGPLRATQEMASPTDALRMAYEKSGAVNLNVQTQEPAESFIPEPPDEVFSDPVRGSEIPSAFGYGAQEMVLDFERDESPRTSLPENMVSFDIDVNGAAAKGEADSYSFDDEVAETRLLETPTWPSDASSFAIGRETTVLGSVLGAVEDSATSTLLAVDEPLGDVLLEERGEQATLYEPDSEPMPLMDEALIEPFGFDLESQEVEAEPAFRQDPEYQDLGLEDEEEGVDVAPPLDLDDAFGDRQAFYDEARPVTVEEGAQSSGQESTSDAVLESESPLETVLDEATEQDRREDNPVDWAEPRYEFDAATEVELQPEETDEVEIFEAAETAEASHENPGLEDSRFTASTMWTEEETRFTPIDIEALPVEEDKANKTSGVAYDQGETGFDFMPIASEAAEEPEAAQAPTVSSAAALPQGVVDDIVRRVVAEMGDSIVREVAWEVVPDLVERVIEKLARESLSKRV